MDRRRFLKTIAGGVVFTIPELILPRRRVWALDQAMIRPATPRIACRDVYVRTSGYERYPDRTAELQRLIDTTSGPIHLHREVIRLSAPVRVHADTILLMDEAVIQAPADGPYLTWNHQSPRAQQVFTPPSRRG